MTQFGFSPLAGIRFVERTSLQSTSLSVLSRFSPLAGIRFVESFPVVLMDNPGVFQSPCGD